MSAVANQKPFPWKCAHCGQRTISPVAAAYSCTMEHDGRSYLVEVADLDTPRCSNCGEIVLDDGANRRLSEAFRQQLGLLEPAQIRSNREQLGKTQRELAGLLGIAEATLSRWETGVQVQQRAMDRLLRLFFALPAVQNALADEPGLRHLGSALNSPALPATPLAP